MKSWIIKLSWQRSKDQRGWRGNCRKLIPLKAASKIWWMIIEWWRWLQRNWIIEIVHKNETSWALRNVIYHHLSMVSHTLHHRGWWLEVLVILSPREINTRSTFAFFIRETLRMNGITICRIHSRECSSKRENHSTIIHSHFYGNYS